MLALVGATLAPLGAGIARAAPGGQMMGLDGQGAHFETATVPAQLGDTQVDLVLPWQPTPNNPIPPGYTLASVSFPAGQTGDLTDRVLGAEFCPAAVVAAIAPATATCVELTKQECSPGGVPTSPTAICVEEVTSLFGQPLPARTVILRFISTNNEVSLVVKLALALPTTRGHEISMEGRFYNAAGEYTSGIATLRVSHGVVTELVAEPVSAVAGEAVDAIVFRAFDSFGNPADTYERSANVSSSDERATHPLVVQFMKGTATVMMPTFRTAGAQTLGLCQAGTQPGPCGSAEVVVSPGPLARVAIENAGDVPGLAPVFAASGTQQTWHVRGYDAWDNLRDAGAVALAVESLTGVPCGEISTIDEQGAFVFLATASTTDTSALAAGEAPLGCRVSATSTEKALPGTTGVITVQPTPVASIVIRDAPNGGGSPVGDVALTADERLELFAAGYDAQGNYVGDLTATWSSGVCGKLAPQPPGPAVIFDATDVGVCSVTASLDALTDVTGEITVSAGVLAQIDILDGPDHTGDEVDSLVVGPGTHTFLWAAGHDADGNYVGDQDAEWAVLGVGVPTVLADCGEIGKTEGIEGLLVAAQAPTGDLEICRLVVRVGVLKPEIVPIVVKDVATLVIANGPVTQVSTATEPVLYDADAFAADATEVRVHDELDLAWTIAPAEGGAFDANELTPGNAAGSYAVTAAFGAVQATEEFSITAGAIASFVLSCPASRVTVATGVTCAASDPRDEHDNPTGMATLHWWVNDSTGAPITNAGGAFTAPQRLENGDVSVVASMAGVTRTAVVRLKADILDDFTLGCQPASGVTVNDAVLCTAADGVDRFGNPQDIGTLTWNATDASGAGIPIPAGAFTTPTDAARSPVTVRAEGATGGPETRLVAFVADSLASVQVTGPTSLVAGETETYTTTLYDSHGNVLGTRTQEFSSIVAGDHQVCDDLDSPIEDCLGVTVVPAALSRVEVTGPSPIVAGETETYTTTLYDEHNNVRGTRTQPFSSEVAGEAQVCDTVDSPIQDCLDIDVDPATLDRVEVTGPAQIVAGETETYTTTLYDEFDNVRETRTQTFSRNVAGSAQVCDNMDAPIVDCLPVTVLPAALHRVQVTGPSPIAAGETETYTTTLYDAFDNVRGTRTQTFRSEVAGPAQICDDVDAPITHCLGIDVDPAALARVQVSGPESITAGTSHTYTTTLYDAFDNVIGTRTQQFSSTSAGEFEVCDEIDSPIEDCMDVTVIAAALSRIDVTGPTPIVAGTTHAYTTTLYDAFNNPIATRSQDFGSTTAGQHPVCDTEGTLEDCLDVTVGPAALDHVTVTGDEEIVAGTTHEYTTTLYDQFNNVRGTRTQDFSSIAAGEFEVCDDADDPIADCLDVTVVPAPLHHVTVTGAVEIVAGTTHEYTTTLYDQFDNVRGTRTQDFSSDVAGAFEVCDTLDAPIEDCLDVTVIPAALHHVVVTGVQEIVAGTSHEYTTTLYDAFGNVIGTRSQDFSSETAGEFDVCDTLDVPIEDCLDVTVVPAPLHHVTVTGNEEIVAGTTHEYTTTLYDAFGNAIGTRAKDFSSDVAGAFEVCDTLDAPIEDCLDVTVIPAALHHVVVTGVQEIVAGTSHEYTTTLYDAFGNVIGTRSQDFSSELAGDFEVCDDADSPIEDCLDVTVVPAALDHVLVTGDEEIVAGTTHEYTTMLYDAFGNAIGTRAKDFSSDVAGAFEVCDTLDAPIEDCLDVTVVPAALHHVVVTGDEEIPAGATRTYTTTLYDGFGNVRGTRTREFSSDVVGDFEVCDDADSPIEDCLDVTVVPAPLHHVTVAGDEEIVAGTSHEYTTTLYDAFENVRGTREQEFSSTLAGPTEVCDDTDSPIEDCLDVMVLPADLHHVLVTGDEEIVAGVSHTYTTTLYDEFGNVRGTRTQDFASEVVGDFAVCDDIDAPIEDCLDVAVVPAALEHVTVTGDEEIVAGTSHEYTTTLYDAFDNVIGTRAQDFASNIAGAFQVCDAEDAPIEDCLDVTVVPAALHHVTVTGDGSIVAGTTHEYTTTLYDEFGNVRGTRTQDFTSNVAGRFQVCDDVDSPIEDCLDVSVVPADLHHVTVTGDEELAAGVTSTYTTTLYDEFDNVRGTRTQVFSSTTAGGFEVCDDMNAPIEDCLEVTVVPAALHHVIVTGEATLEAGASGTYTTTLYDEFNNVRGTRAQTFSSDVAGSFEVCDDADSPIEDCLDVTVVPATLATVDVTGPTPIVAGTTHTYTTTLYDQFGNVIGTRTQSFSSNTAGGFQVCDTQDSPIEDCLAVTVVAAALHHFTVDCATPVQSGSGSSCSAQARDAFGNLRPETPSWTASAGGFSAATGGSTTYFPLTTAGTYTVTASSGAVSTPFQVVVTPGPLSRFAVEPADPTQVSADAATYTIVATALDSAGNVLGPNVAVHWTLVDPAPGNSGPAGSLSASMTTTGADGKARVTLTTSAKAGDDYRVRAADAATDPEVQKTSGTLTVVLGALASAIVTGDEEIVAGTTHTYTTTLYDAHGNVRGTRTQTFSSNAAGDFEVCDDADSPIEDCLDVTVVPAALDHVTVTGDETIVAGTTHAYTTTLYDVFDNVIGTRTQTFSSNLAGDFEVCDDADSPIEDCLDVTVTVAELDHVVVTGDEEIVAGTTHTYTTTLYDEFENVIGTRTQSFTSTVAGAFEVCDDADDPIVDCLDVVVVPAALDRVAVTGADEIAAGETSTYTTTLYDGFDNVIGTRTQDFSSDLAGDFQVCDDADSPIEDCLDVTVVPAALHHVLVTGDETIVAGTTHTYTTTLYDAFDNVIATRAQTFSSTVAGDFEVCDDADDPIVDCLDVTVTVAEMDRVDVTGDETIVAGTTHAYTTTLYDAFDNVIGTRTQDFSSDVAGEFQVCDDVDSPIEDCLDVTVVAAALHHVLVSGEEELVAGATRTYTTTLYDAFDNVIGARTQTFSSIVAGGFEVCDDADSPIEDCLDVTVVPAALDHVTVTGDETIVAGTSSTYTTTLYDEFDNVRGTRTQTFSSTVAGDFEVCDDADSPIEDCLDVTVVPAALDHVTVTGDDTIVAGTTHTYTTTLYDVHGNVIGTRAQTFSSDEVGAFQVCDDADSPIEDCLAVDVIAAALHHFAVDCDTPVRPGESAACSAQARDAFENARPEVPSWSATAGGFSSAMGLNTVYYPPVTASTYTVSASSGAVSTSFQVEVTPGDLARFDITPLPGSFTDVSADLATQEIVATARDGNGNALGMGLAVYWQIVDPGTANTGSGAALSSASSLTDAQGKATVLLTTSRKAGDDFRVRAMDAPVDPSILKLSGTIRVIDGALDRVAVTGDEEIAAGATGTYTTTRYDAYDNVLGTRTQTFSSEIAGEYEVCDDVDSPIEDCLDVTVVPAALDHVTVTGDETIVAGTTHTYTTTLYDAFDNVIGTRSQTFSSTTAGDFEVCDNADSPIVDCLDVTVVVAELHHVTVTGDLEVVAGTTSTYTTTQYDAFNNVIGTRTQTFTSTVAGSYEVCDTQDAPIEDCLDVTVVPAALDTIEVTGEETIVAGATHTYTTTLYDAFGNVIGTRAQTFSSSNAGEFDVCDTTDSPIEDCLEVTVVADALHHVTVTGDEEIVAGVASTYTTTLYDAFGNVIGTRTQDFTSEIAGGFEVCDDADSPIVDCLDVTVVPAALDTVEVTGEETIAAGATHTYMTTLYDAFGNVIGTRTQTFSSDAAGDFEVCDDADSPIEDCLDVTVTAATLHRVVVTGDEEVVAGATHTYTTTLYDAFDNVIGTRTQDFSSNAAGDFEVCDDVDSPIEDCLDVTVVPAALHHVVVTGAASITAGATATYTTTQYDAFDNVIGTRTQDFSSDVAGSYAVCDDADSPIEDCLDVTVTAASLDRVVVAGDEEVTAGETSTYTTTLYDVFDNVIGTRTQDVSSTTAGDFEVCDNADSPIVDCLDVTVVPAALHHVIVTGDPAIVADASHTYMTTQYDAFGNVIGTRTQDFSNQVAGVYQVCDAVDSPIEDCLDVTVVPAALHHVTVTGDETIVAGATHTYITTLYDAFDNVISMRTQDFSSNAAGDFQVCDAADSPIEDCLDVTVVVGELHHVTVNGDQEVVADTPHTYTTTLYDAFGNVIGTRTQGFSNHIAGEYQVCDAVDSPIDDCLDVTVVPAALHHVTVTGDETIAAGATHTYTTTLYDAFDNVISTRTQEFISDLTGDFEVCDDADFPIEDCLEVTVVPAALDHVTVTGAEEIVAGTTHAYTTTLYDEFDNVIGTRTQDFSSNAAGDFEVCDDVDSPIQDCLDVTVVPAALHHVVVTGDEEIAAGATSTYTTTGYDEFDNVIGTRTQEFSSESVGAYSVCDTEDEPIQDCLEVTVVPAPLDHFLVICDTPVTPGSSSACAALAQDAFGNARDEVPTWSATAGGFSAGTGLTTTYYPPVATGTYTVSATHGEVTSTFDVDVSPGTLARFILEPIAGTTTSVSADVRELTFVATALDGNDNPLGAGLTVYWTLIDPNAPNGGDGAMLSSATGVTGSNGQASVTLTTSALADDDYRVRVADDATEPTILRTSGVVQVIPGEPVRLDVTCAATCTSAGTPIDVTIEAFDAQDNLVDTGANAFVGSKSVSFAGPVASPDGVEPLCNGLPVGEGTMVSFALGSATVTCTLYNAETTTLDATVGTIHDATPLDLTVAPDVPAKLAIFASPSDATSDEDFTVVVHVLDTYGNLVTDATNGVELAIETGPLSGLLEGGAEAAAVGGVATFAVDLDLEGVYTLTAAAEDLASATTEEIAVHPGAPARLAFAATLGTQVSLAPFEVQVEVLDVAGNRNVTAEHAITLAKVTGPATGQVDGTLTVDAVAGLATFDDVTLDINGTYTLGATATGLDAAPSTDDILVVPGAPFRLVFSRLQTDPTAGVEFQADVLIQDEAGNHVLDAIDAVELAHATGAGPLGGTLSAEAVGGVATFSDLTLERIGEHTLTASSLFDDVTSSVISPWAAPATKLVFIASPAEAAIAGDCTAYSVQVQDEFGNPNKTDDHTVMLDDGGAAGGFYGDDECGDAITSTPIFAPATAAVVYYRSTADEDLALEAAEAGLDAATHELSVYPAAAHHFALSCESGCPATAGIAIEVKVAAEDIFGNPLWRGPNLYEGDVEMDFGGAANAPSGTAATCEGETLAQTPLVTFALGNATVSCVLYAAGTASLTATDGTISQDAALDVTVTAADGTALRITMPGQSFSTATGLVTGSATPRTAGLAFNVDVRAIDPWNNVATGYDGSKTLEFTGALDAYTGVDPTVAGIALGEETTVAFTAGVATSIPVVLYRNQTGVVLAVTDTGTDGPAGAASAVSVFSSSATSLAVSTCSLSSTRANRDACLVQSLSVTDGDTLGLEDERLYRSLTVDAYDNLVGATSATWVGSGEPATGYGGTTSGLLFTPNAEGIGTFTLTHGSLAGVVFSVTVG